MEAVGLSLDDISGISVAGCACTDVGETLKVRYLDQLFRNRIKIGIDPLHAFVCMLSRSVIIVHSRLPHLHIKNIPFLHVNAKQKRLRHARQDKQGEKRQAAIIMVDLSLFLSLSSR